MEIYTDCWDAAFCLLGRAYDYVITTPSENGVLFDNYVHCIYEDSDGYIWVGTGSTVERFDGITGQVYKFEEGMPNYAPHLVNTILEKKGMNIGLEMYMGCFN